MSEQTVATIEERVAKGAALLDQERPGWWQEIDLDTLSLRSGCDCVLGQLYESFDDGVEILDLEWPEDSGFDLEGWPTDRTQAWNDLTAAWRSLIEARRQAQARGAAEAGQ